MKDFVAKVKQIGLKDFNFSDFSKQDLDRFVASIQEIQTLASTYPESHTRKQIADEICEKIKPIETFLWIVGNELKSLKNRYEYSDEFVSDVDLAMNLLVRLANIGNENHVLRTFYISDFCSQETRHGDKEHSLAEGTVWVIGHKRFIAPIEDKVYYGCELGKILTNLTDSGIPLVVCTNHYFKNNVLPLHYSVTLERYQIYTVGLTSEIICYLSYPNDGALMDAVTMFRAYMHKNGGDISGINQDKLFELIRNI